jgi:hypothetical protein
MPKKDNRTQQILEVLEEVEATLGECRGYLSKRASKGKKVAPEEMNLTLRINKVLKIVHNQIEAKENIKGKTYLEKIAGKKVKEITHHECDECGDLGYAELITFADGTRRISCEFGNSRRCKLTCGFELF